MFSEKEHQLEVDFREIGSPEETKFKLKLDMRISYVEVAEAVAKELQIEPQFLQFTTHKWFVFRVSLWHLQYVHTQKNG